MLPLPPPPTLPLPVLSSPVGSPVLVLAPPEPTGQPPLPLDVMGVSDGHARPTVKGTTLPCMLPIPGSSTGRGAAGGAAALLPALLLANSPVVTRFGIVGEEDAGPAALPAAPVPRPAPVRLLGTSGVSGAYGSGVLFKLTDVDG